MDRREFMVSAAAVTAATMLPALPARASHPVARYTAGTVVKFRPTITVPGAKILGVSRVTESGWVDLPCEIEGEKVTLDTSETLEGDIRVRIAEPISRRQHYSLIDYPTRS